MGKHINHTTKDTIIAAIKNDGISVPDAAKQYQVSTKSIYRWLGQLSDGSKTSILEMNKLKRENTQLKEIIGALLLDQEKSKKNR